jgi:hypothetical protein
MRYALVNAQGESEGIILWDGVTPYEPPPGYSLVPEDQAPAVAAPEPVPSEVTNFQARAALLRAGLFDQVNAAVYQAGGEAWQAWEYANTLTRHGATVTALAAGLGLSDAQLDDLFLAAAGIEA